MCVVKVFRDNNSTIIIFKRKKNIIKQLLDKVDKDKTIFFDKIFKLYY